MSNDFPKNRETTMASQRELDDLQKIMDETCLTKFCGFGRDTRVKQSQKSQYNRLEIFRAYKLHNPPLFVFWCFGVLV